MSALILGGSRGLGQALHKHLGGQVVSRTQGRQIDLSQPNSVQKVLELISGQTQLVVYCAGGGPHGSLLNKPIHSQRWALELNLLTPLALIQSLLGSCFKGRFVYVGSAIAERDLSSNSYNLAKQTMLKELKGLNSSRVHVFSPPYMDTLLLPPKAWPRLKAPQSVLPVEQVANAFVHWLQTEVQSGSSGGLHFDWLQRFEYTLPQKDNL